ncbi:putative bifunctional diguanylate cyclase/phosphodiesterase [Dactylosporangium sp. CA-052675]|uniref:putative bifunctional diguanylate cyclase/phosphodiesterase n=1 Tax=Dactylosporangium sp. CA-052675 TaxID=3239927 RepID=UPI003D9007B9
MGGDDRVVRPFRLTTGLLVLAVAAAVLAAWLAGVLARAWEAPLAGWAMLPVLSGVAAAESWRASGARGLTIPARNFWRCVAISSAMLGLGAISNAYDALHGPGAPSQKLSPLTLGLFISASVITQIGLLRLPGARAQRGGSLQLLLDSGTVMITVALVAWHFSFRHAEAWAKVSGSVWPAVVAVVAGCASIAVFVKLASTGIGAIERGALRILAVATGVAAAAGAMAPAYAAFPAISDGHVTTALASVFIAFAADRQRRAADLPPPPPLPARRWSVLPYLAVAAANGLLLVADQGPDGRVLTAGTVLLTLVVVARQIHAFRDNARLLETVDRTVAQLREARDQLASQAAQDALTGLGNRRLLARRMEEMSGTPPHRLHLAIIDLDDFKQVNDRLGHNVGDELLRAVAVRLTGVVGTAGTVVRLGGDEFAILTDAEPCAADALAARLADALQQPLTAGTVELMVRASIGLTDAEGPEGPAGSADSRELLRRADVAMYAAKDRGKHRIARYTADLDAVATEDARIAAELRRAIDAGELHMVYQPIVRLPDGVIEAAESLIRWTHPQRGSVPPSVFIPVAERTGLIAPLGEWILREACAQAVRLRDLGVDAESEEPIRITVNVSARQLRDPDFPATVRRIMGETGADPGRLTVEVTETAVFDDDLALASVRTLREMGLRIALDDFGTGHSSLGLLQICPVDVLKVDKSFVDEIGAGGSPAVIATALLQIADGLRLRAVAEGVETPEQARQLYSLGYRYAQGYHFHRPMPADDLVRVLGLDGQRPRRKETASASPRSVSLGS